MGNVGVYIDLENILYSLINDYKNVSIDIKGKLRNPTEVLKIIRNKAAEYGELIHCEAFYCKGGNSIIEGKGTRDTYWDKNELFRALNDLMIESRDIYQRKNPFTKKPTQNLADNYLIVTVMKHIFELPIIDTFVIVAGDGGYFPLYSEIIRRRKKLVVVTLEIPYADWLEAPLEHNEVHRIFLDELLGIKTEMLPQALPIPPGKQEEPGLRIGEIFSASVKELTGEGASVKLENGEEAFLSKWNMSWHWVDDPASIIQKGKQIDVQVLEMTDGGVRVGRRQLSDPPLTEEKISLAHPVKVKIMEKISDEAIVKMEDGCYGYVSSQDILWTYVQAPLERLKIGETVKAKILEFVPKREKGWIHFGIKQVILNPWDNPRFKTKYRKGEPVLGKISRFVTAVPEGDGASVDLEPAISGVIWIPGVKDYAKEKKKKKGYIKSVEEVLKIGQKVKLIVHEFNEEKKRITLTLEEIIE